MKKQAHYTPDTPIKGSAQAAGFLRENLRVLDHEESWILLLNGANLPGIGAWLRKNKIASPLGYKERSGFCQYELYAFHRHA